MPLKHEPVDFFQKGIETLGQRWIPLNSGEIVLLFLSQHTLVLYSAVIA